jgi:hypothetical protein
MTLKFPEFVRWLRESQGLPTDHTVVNVQLNQYRFFDERAQAAYEGWLHAQEGGYMPMDQVPTRTGLYEVVWTFQGLHEETHMVSAFVPFCTCHGWAKHQVDIWVNHTKKSASVLKTGIAWRAVETHEALGEGTTALLKERFFTSCGAAA